MQSIGFSRISAGVAVALAIIAGCRPGAGAG